MSRSGTPAVFEEQAKLFDNRGGLWLDYRHCDQPYIAERGIGRYARALVSELRAVEGLELRLIEDSDWPPLPRGVGLDRLVGQHVRFPYRLRKVRPALVHFLNPELATPFAPRPYVVTVHDLMRLRHPAWFPPLRRKALLQWRLAEAAIRRASAVVAVSDSTARDVEQLLGVKRERITVTPLAPWPGFCPADPDACRARLSRELGLSGQYVLCVGGFDPRKSVAELVRTFAGETAVGAAELVLAGPFCVSQSFVDVIESISAFRLWDRVILTSHVPDDLLADLYRCASVLVFPSQAEGFGIPLVEAMACGTPVVAFNNSAVPEVLGDAGVLCDTGDFAALWSAVADILGSEATRREFSAGGLRRAADFTWARCALLTREAYSYAIATCARRGRGSP